MEHKLEDVRNVGDRIWARVGKPSEEMPPWGCTLGQKDQTEVVSLVRMEEGVAGMVIFDGVPLLAPNDDKLYTIPPFGPAIPTDVTTLPMMTPLQQQRQAYLFKNAVWVCKLINPCYDSLTGEDERGTTQWPTVADTLQHRPVSSPAEFNNVIDQLILANIPKYLGSLMGVYGFYRQDRPLPAALTIHMQGQPPEVREALYVDYIRRRETWQILRGKRNVGQSNELENRIRQLT